MGYTLPEHTVDSLGLEPLRYTEQGIILKDKSFTHHCVLWIPLNRGLLHYQCKKDVATTDYHLKGAL